MGCILEILMSVLKLNLNIGSNMFKLIVDCW